VSPVGTTETRRFCRPYGTCLGLCRGVSGSRHLCAGLCSAVPTGLGWHLSRVRCHVGRWSGGVATLNHRLLAARPSAWRTTVGEKVACVRGMRRNVREAVSMCSLWTRSATPWVAVVRTGFASFAMFATHGVAVRGGTAVRWRPMGSRSEGGNATHGVAVRVGERHEKTAACWDTRRFFDDEECGRAGRAPRGH
jgi:hypothetical protein